MTDYHDYVEAELHSCLTHLGSKLGGVTGLPVTLLAPLQSSWSELETIYTGNKGGGIKAISLKHNSCTENRKYYLKFDCKFDYHLLICNQNKA